MKRKLPPTVIATIRSAARKLKGFARRSFQAEATHDYCNGSPRLAERTFGWSRNSIQKGLDEKMTGTIISPLERSGRPSYSDKHAALQNGIRSLVDPHSHTHPAFENTFCSTRMSERCKHRGMSWTQTGVLAMALHAAGVKRNATQTEKKQRKKAHHPVNGRKFFGKKWCSALFFKPFLPPNIRNNQGFYLLRPNCFPLGNIMGWRHEQG